MTGYPAVHHTGAMITGGIIATVETAAARETIADIAVLDDDLDFRTYLEDFLKDESVYSVRAFASAPDLYAGCEERSPDIVLLDMKMGDVTGDKVLEQLLTRWPGMCVIIITGYPSLEDMRATFKLKVFDYLSKPFSLAQLRAESLKECGGCVRAGPFPPGSSARASGAQHQDAARGARLVTQRSGESDQAQRLPDERHRTWN